MEEAVGKQKNDGLPLNRPRRKVAEPDYISLSHLPYSTFEMQEAILKEIQRKQNVGTSSTPGPEPTTTKDEVEDILSEEDWSKTRKRSEKKAQKALSEVGSKRKQNGTQKQEEKGAVEAAEESEESPEETSASPKKKKGRSNELEKVVFETFTFHPRFYEFDSSSHMLKQGRDAHKGAEIYTLEDTVTMELEAIYDSQERIVVHSPTARRSQNASALATTSVNTGIHSTNQHSAVNGLKNSVLRKKEARKRFAVSRRRLSIESGKMDSGTLSSPATASPSPSPSSSGHRFSSDSPSSLMFGVKEVSPGSRKRPYAASSLFAAGRARNANGRFVSMRSGSQSDSTSAQSVGSSSTESSQSSFIYPVPNSDTQQNNDVTSPPPLLEATPQSTHVLSSLSPPPLSPQSSIHEEKDHSTTTEVVSTPSVTTLVKEHETGSERKSLRARKPNTRFLDSVSEEETEESSMASESHKKHLPAPVKKQHISVSSVSEGESSAFSGVFNGQSRRDKVQQLIDQKAGNTSASLAPSPTKAATAHTTPSASNSETKEASEKKLERMSEMESGKGMKPPPLPRILKGGELHKDGECVTRAGTLHASLAWYIDKYKEYRYHAFGDPFKPWIPRQYRSAHVHVNHSHTQPSPRTSHPITQRMGNNAGYSTSYGSRSAHSLQRSAVSSSSSVRGSNTVPPSWRPVSSPSTHRSINSNTMSTKPQPGYYTSSNQGRNVSVNALRHKTTPSHGILIAPYTYPTSSSSLPLRSSAEMSKSESQTGYLSPAHSSSECFTPQGSPVSTPTLPSIRPYDSRSKTYEYSSSPSPSSSGKKITAGTHRWVPSSSAQGQPVSRTNTPTGIKLRPYTKSPDFSTSPPPHPFLPSLSSASSSSSSSDYSLHLSPLQELGLNTSESMQLPRIDTVIPKTSLSLVK